jgi:superfamily II DNA/RNA helicase
VSTVVLGADAPVQTFADLGVPDALVTCLNKSGITNPLPIQAKTIADAMAGRDVSAKAPTGSGKTLAFALPLAAKASRGIPKRPAALVLAPTRELATQIADTLRPLLAVRDLKVQTFFGGAGFGAQRNALRKGVDVAVACPGRLEDLISQGDVNLSRVDFVVIDEADRMADMGFLPAVKRILDATTTDRQTLLYSATLDGAVDVLVRRYQREPAFYEVSSSLDEIDRVTHRFASVTVENRLESCTELVGGEGTSIVFARTKHGVDRLAKQLSKAGIAAAPIHGGRSQSDREKALAHFRAGRVRVLVATDVAARGIHVDGVTRVVHFDLPADSKDYIHRSGRTGRTGADGSVVAFVLPDQQLLAKTLRRDLKIDPEHSPGPRPGSKPGTPHRRPPVRGRTAPTAQGHSRSDRDRHEGSRTGDVRVAGSAGPSRRRPTRKGYGSSNGKGYGAGGGKGR